MLVMIENFKIYKNLNTLTNEIKMTKSEFTQNQVELYAYIMRLSQAITIN